MEKEQNLQELYKMKLGERIKYSIFDIWRVPGGWMFAIDGGDIGVTSTFVPFNNEFMENETR